MKDAAKGLVAPDGRPARAAQLLKCPQCGAGKDKRLNTAGFGPPVICCGKCGYHYEGATE